MNFRDLKEVVNAANLHDLADTTVESVSVHMGGLDVVFDTTDIEAERDEAKANEAELAKQLTASEAKIEALEAEAEKTREVMEAIKGKDPAESLALYLQRATDAEAEADTARENSRQWKYARDDAERECKALRKRKGVEAGLVRNARGFMSLLGYIANSPIERLPEYRATCAELLAKINAT